MLNTNTNLQTQTSNALHNAIMEAGGKDRPPMLAPVAEGSSETTIEGYMENYTNVSQDIRDQLKAEAEAVQIILTRIDNDIYFTVDACPNACEMWKVIERLKQGESINVQDLGTNLYWEFGKFTSWDGESLESYYSRGKAIVNSSTPTYDQEPTMLALDDEMSKEKEIDKLMALISLSFKKIYKPTNNNLRTSSNTSRANPDNTLRINRGTGYDNQRVVNVAGARENVGTPVVQQSGIQCYNCKEYGHRDDTDDEPDDQELEAYYMYMAQIQEVTPDAIDNSEPIFDAEPLQKDDHDDDDDLAKERDLLASLIEKLKCEIDESKNRNKFLETSNKALVDKLKDLKKFQAELDRYHDVNYASNVVIDCAKAKGDLMSYKMKSEKSFNEYTQKINDLNQTISEMKKELFAHQETISIMSQEKEARIKFYKTREDKEIEKVLNETDRLSREYYYADHMNSILGMYTEMDEVTNLQCDYLEALEKCECLKKELSKSRTMSNSFEALQKHAINLELDLQQCKEKIKNDKSFKENQSNVFLKEREQYFEIQDLKAQLQDKGIAIRVIPTTSVSRPQLKSNQLEDRVMPNNSQWKKQEVEDPHRNFKFSNNKTFVTTCNDNLNAKTLNVNFVCVTCGKCVLNDNQDMCVLHYINGVNSRTKMPMAVPLVEIILFIVDSGCSKHMTGNLKLLSNFVEKFLGTVKFGNDQIAPILGYGDLVQGNITIKRVYYVEGLNHNLFSVGQFCDADLEVAFRKSTCYIRDLKGNDLLTGSRGTDLYSITLQDTSTPNPICLMAKASSSQAWLWHRRLSHLNFDSINLLSKNDIVIGLPKLKFVKDHLCSSCELGKAKRKYTWTGFLRSKDETPKVLIDFLKLVQRGLHAQVRIVRTDKGTKFLNKTLHAYFAQEGIKHQTSMLEHLNKTALSNILLLRLLEQC
ncbi:retrovirus-related pol polyprotein from transposon TNT 1-94 [Tanacetum coccineum]